MSVFVYLHIIQKRIRKFMSHRNICVCLYFCLCNSPRNRYMLHSGIKWTTSSIQASALNVLSQFPFILSTPYSIPFNRRLITERGASFLFILHFVSQCSVIDSVEMSACLNHCWPGVWSHQVGSKLVQETDERKT